ncbi:AAAP family transporter: amino acid [Ostreococcus lucimarinus CCE9901]|uniref:AAAP family transporter: amino acid n=1 Tax=Ostreococcus lucimarinus (strain CCE9901) TaxID=436017 RepID=A4RZ95_OSTLU|nr:AAAP family transporter: amino acid [Ostreococcus lucimarinus CCE9901]ABO96585.1 AAAP family transporter: amino acid [Ostreococcus lucimarinus CCE9901]|eukprot:XP_001418292.1 AAAP family transporter: amino acid [Ostreococcus lucimarinus CCE9901]
MRARATPRAPAARATSAARARLGRAAPTRPARDARERDARRRPKTPSRRRPKTRAVVDARERPRGAGRGARTWDDADATREVGTSTTAQARANAVNILLGVGTLSVPYALREAGWSGLGVLMTLGVVTNYTGKILIKCQRRGSLPANERSDIGEAAFGVNGRNFITFVLYTELIGTAGLFFILEGDHLAKLFHMQGKEELFSACAALAMVPTTWLLDLSSLSYVGALGLCASVSVTGVMLYELFSQVISTGELPRAAAETAMIHYSTFPVSFGLLAFVFAGHAVFPAIYASMEKPEEYEEMLDNSYAIVALNCLALGVAGYCLYGDNVADQVTLNLPAGSLATLAFALITVNPLAKFALTLDPVAKGAEEKLKLRVKESSKDAFISRLVRTTLGVTALGIAVKLPFFGVGMSLIGSVLTLTVSVLFPSLCYLRMFDDDIDDAEKLINYAILAIGTACVVSGTAGALDSAFAVAA